MDLEEFWALIAVARSRGGEDPEAVAEHVIAELAGGPVERIFAFEQFRRGLTRRAYDWLLWAAAYRIGGGCSDDAFIDFRASLVLQGRETFERALRDPDSLADLPAVRAIPTGGEAADDDVLFLEPACYPAADAYQRLHDGTRTDFEAALEAWPDAERDPGPHPGPSGDAFDFDDDVLMRERLPRLAALLP